jgi:ABC-type amino acid transport substrate-binding protein
MNNLVMRTWPILIVALIKMIWVPMASAEPAEIKTLKLGVREDAPPFAYVEDDKSKFVGYSVDLCDKIGHRAVNEGMYDKIEFVKVSSKTRFEDLQNNKVDILCEATTVTLERIRDYRQSLYTFLSGASFMYQLPIKKLNKLDNLKIGVLRDTTTEEHLRGSIWPKLSVELKRLGFNRVDEFELVSVEKHWQKQNKEFFSRQKIDIYIADREILVALKRLSRKGNYRVAPQYYSIEPYALFTRRDDVELIHIANTTLRDLYSETSRSGNIKEILKKNFPDQILSSTLLQLFRLQRLLD